MNLKGTDEEAMDGKYERRVVGYLIPKQQFVGEVSKNRSSKEA